MTPTGDHRFLDGEFIDGELRLSKFDGGHVFLYRGTLQDDGSMRGKFWSGTAFEDSFVARRDDNASLGDAENATKLVGKADRLDFRFPDLAGHDISINDPFFYGKVVIVTLAGSWCPNCHDEAAFLAELHRKRRAEGLEVISLMFEQFGDFKRAAEATDRFRRRYGIEYTTLIAGTSDKDDAASKLPQLNGVFAFPTTIFVDRQGKVRKIHTGFSGPATGQHYDKLVVDFTKTLDTLLALLVGAGEAVKDLRPCLCPKSDGALICPPSMPSRKSMPTNSLTRSIRPIASYRSGSTSKERPASSCCARKTSPLRYAAKSSFT